MLKRIKSLMDSTAEKVKGADLIDLSLAVCVILLEMAEVDDEISPEELKHLTNTLKSKYGLSEAEARELMDVAAAKRAQSIDLWSFTNRINETHSREEKQSIIEEIWRIIYADGVLSAHEDYLVRKLVKLLKLKHSEMIEAKLKVKEEF